MIAAATYLGRTLWPSGLAAFHPRPAQLPIGVLVVAAGTLAAASACALALAREQRWVLVGWLWFLGMLVPVSGIVQVGSQAFANRYTYLPAIGLYLIAAFAARALVAWRGALRAPVGAGLAVVLLAWAALARVEVGYWRDAETLFARALEVTDANWLAHTNLGLALLESGERERAIEQLEAALVVDPNLFPAVAALGHTYAEQGDYHAALPLLARAVRLAPPHELAPGRNLAEALVRVGDPSGAVLALEHHVALHPDDQRARSRLAELRGGMRDE